VAAGELSGDQSIERIVGAYAATGGHSSVTPTHEEPSHRRLTLSQQIRWAPAIRVPTGVSTQTDCTGLR
jgi:hypothetical protein